MPFNGSGVFQRLRRWVDDAAAGIKIRADYHDAEDDGIAAGLSNTITRDGQSTITQNIPFNSKRITGLANPVNPQDAATKFSADAGDALKVAKAGDNMTGHLTQTGAAPLIGLYRTAAGANQALIRGGVLDAGGAQLGRWDIYLGDTAAEDASNNGSNLQIIYRDNAGVGLGNALTGSRATGLLTVKGPPTTGLGIATKAYVDATDVLKVDLAGDTMTGKLGTKNSGIIPVTANPDSLQVNAATGAGSAAMAFVIGTTFSASFGMGGDGHFYMGGMSHGATAYKFWTQRDVPVMPISGVRLSLAGTPLFNQPASLSPNVYEPFAGAVITGWSYALSGGVDPVVVSFRMRYVQVLTGTNTWATVAYTV